MPSPSPEALALGARYALRWAELPWRGGAGERMGKGVGSSLEFQERRGYVPGDDVRHLDWQAYARTDQLMVRLYRDEVLPRVDFVVDGSRSMAVDTAKAQRAVDLVGLLVTAARSSGFEVRTILAGDGPELVERRRLETSGLAFESTVPLLDAVRATRALSRPGSMTVLVSDFLSSFDPAELVRPLASRSSRLCLLQLLGAEDLDPPSGQALRLTDSETGGVLDVVLDANALHRYRERLELHSDALHEECRRSGAAYVRISATETLEAHCRGPLSESVLAPA